MSDPKITLAVVFALFGFISPICAEKVANLQEKEISLVRDEVQAIAHLIGEQKKHLIRMEELRALMVEFREKKEAFTSGNQTQKHAYAMVDCAREILSGINEERISHLFSSEFLEELVFFSSVAGKSRPIRP